LFEGFKHCGNWGLVMHKVWRLWLSVGVLLWATSCHAQSGTRGLSLDTPGPGLVFHQATSNPWRKTTAYVAWHAIEWNIQNNWGFHANVGLTSLNPERIARLGQVVEGREDLDNMVRALRLSPLIELRVHYAF
jgi:hypothetical protein